MADYAIERDGFGIATVTAASASAAFRGMGYAAGRDRLWQLEYDRRRAMGRWSEVVGPAGIAGDRLARRLDLASAARLDFAALSAATRGTFEQYAEGINAAAAAGLPPEFAACGLDFEPWQPWQSVAAFKIRHVLMGEWSFKLTRALLLAADPELAAGLDPALVAGVALTVPPGAHQGPLGPAVTRLVESAAAELAGARELGFLAESGSGSNVWAIAGSRTRSGAPLLVNDSHRLVDVPNAYWQVRVRCADFDVAGATFPGIPGWPHFGTTHSGTGDAVAWAITHATADTQDLYAEEFRNAGTQVRDGDDWVTVDLRTEQIEVRGAPPVQVHIAHTPRGPVAHGDPRDGWALALSWTAIDRPNRQFDVLLPMLAARTVDELMDTQAGWVDPVNNFVCADRQDIGYLLRGELPLRRQPAATAGPVLGARGGWAGRVPAGEMPRMVSPECGWIANANNPIVDAADGPLVNRYFTAPFRVERIGELLRRRTDWDVAAAAEMQLDTVSLAARAWSGWLAAREPIETDGAAEAGRRRLADWDGNVGDDPAALTYARFRVALARALVEPARAALRRAPVDGVAMLLNRLMTRASLAPESVSRELVDRALAEAWGLDERPEVGDESRLGQRGVEDHGIDAGGIDGSGVGENGVDASWADGLGPWPRAHQLKPRHTLDGVTPADQRPAGQQTIGQQPVGATELPDPPAFGLPGDSDTIRAAGYALNLDTFDVTITTVYRQVVDLADPHAGGWVIPGGASADPRSPHYADQLPLWVAGRLLPIRPRG